MNCVQAHVEAQKFHIIMPYYLTLKLLTQIVLYGTLERTSLVLHEEHCCTEKKQRDIPNVYHEIEGLYFRQG